jgi:threonyl-tRNA synthetase
MCARERIICLSGKASLQVGGFQDIAVASSGGYNNPIYTETAFASATMRILFIHADYMEYEVREKTKDALPIPDELKRGKIDEALVCFITAEEKDEKDVGGTSRAAVNEIQDVAKTVKTTRVVVYPYAHLSPSLAKAAPAREMFGHIAEDLVEAGYEVMSSPFGYYKSFKISCKGHPLSELSREIEVTAEAKKEEVSEAVKAEEKLVSEWFILDPSGRLSPLSIKDGRVDGFDFKSHVNLGKFAIYEMAKSREVKEEPPHTKIMRELELVDYEPGSDPGNFRYYPKGRLIKSLLEEITTRTIIDYGGMEIESPIMYDFEHPALKSYLNRFPARQYILETPNKKTFLRFAACFGQFLMAHDMTLSYRQMPMRLYELTRYSFRAEQRGELAGLRRLRSFTMPDCHAFCTDMGQAKSEMLVRFGVAMSLLGNIGFSVPADLELSIRVTKDFWENGKEHALEMARRWGKPLLLETWDRQFFYYVMKYEINFVDASDKAAALTTDQIDTENAKRFDITYIDADGKRQFPYILHLSPAGAIERNIYALLEKAYMGMKAGKVPILPLWLSPTQVRLVPVSSDQLEYCKSMLSRFESVRADLDDTDDSLNKKIRKAEKEWVPYIAVVGRKEVESGKLNVRERTGKEQTEMTVEELQARILTETKGRPFKPLSLPKPISLRPGFRG